jgi:hypothetical protein
MASVPFPSWAVPVVTKVESHLLFVGDRRKPIPGVVELPRFPGVAVATKHLQVVGRKGQLGIDAARLDVIDLESHAISPRGPAAESTLRSTVVHVRDGVESERFVSQFAPLARSDENTRVQNV